MSHTSFPRRTILGRGTPPALTVLLLVLLFVPSAGGGQVPALTTFTNGTTADADEVNANFEAIRAAVNDNDTRITTLEGASAPIDIDSYAVGTRRGFVTIPANGTVDIQPPANETWLIRSLTGTPTGSNTRVGWTNGTIAFIHNTYSGNGLSGVAIAISDAGWLRLEDTSGNAGTVYYTATVVNAEHVFSLTNVAAAASQEVRPPAGQVWLITNCLSESQFSDPKPAVTDGVNTANGLVRNAVSTAGFVSIDNANYITYTNSTGGVQGLLVTGIRLP